MKIVLLGYGKENQSAEKFLRAKYPEAEFEVVEKVESEIEVRGDLIVRSPSLPPRFVKTDGITTSATKLFYENVSREKIIAVTGTKGKGTTSTIIAEILKASGFKTKVVGNIGEPALDAIAENLDFYIYETSSFQAWDLLASPAVAVILRVEDDHLDKHLSREDYLAAKSNLVRHQTNEDLCVYYAGNELTLQIAEKSAAKKVAYPSLDQAHIVGGEFYYGSDVVCATSELRLIGAHNLENALAAIDATWEIIGGDIEVIKKGLNNVKPLPHRMELVGEIDGVEVWDDNFSASMPSLDVATGALGDVGKKYALIAGGFDRGLGNYGEIASILKREFERGSLRKVWLIGQTASAIAEYLDGFDYVLAGDEFEQTVGETFDFAKANSLAVLMSPGAPSFDMFRDFYDRGQRFQKIIRGLGEFEFLGYAFDDLVLTCRYRSGGIDFEEKIELCGNELTDDILRKYPKTIDKMLQVCYNLIGTSYYKAWPSRTVRFRDGQKINKDLKELLDFAYQEGLSEFAFQNKLRREDLAHFESNVEDLEKNDENYSGEGILSTQSGGKDSLLVAALLGQSVKNWQPCFVANGDHHPVVLDNLGEKLLITQRRLDFANLQKAASVGAMNGHVPITLVLLSISVLQMMLLGRETLLFSISHEGNEPNTKAIKSLTGEADLEVQHQTSKTWRAEKMFAEYVRKNVSSNIKVGSILRGISELKTVELFKEFAWEKFGRRFSSCNRENYRQNADNRELKWCGNCPKCANLFLMLAPFVGSEVKQIFGGQDLFGKESLREDFKGLLGVDGVIKPFECVGEIDELRTAYWMTRLRFGEQFAELPFGVPKADYDYEQRYPMQDWARELFEELVNG
ncbi:MAG: UDP-N-acetylmuramoyl-L-alanine--D-glutamate ligase [Candidatus Nomurabacteria bacterium]|jgi:UDP-N-acetylmuramoylalanine--D-glutamate ligase|nr:UDP-N-acetylmuramoyl-L-alanine--D-glutamate ligase [Candidatus Nomurabacteria bacterium]